MTIGELSLTYVKKNAKSKQKDIKVMKNIEILSETPLFKGLPKDQLLEIANISISKLYKKGEIVFSEGDEGIGFYVVITGMIKIFKASADGKEHILHIFSSGEPFGEVPVFTGNPFPATAQAIADSRLLFFPKLRFVELITKNPSLSLNMLGILSMRLREFTVQIENLSLKEVPARLASYLLLASNEQGTPDAINLNISKSQLASLLGTIPETLSRIFARLTSQNLIEVNGKNIRLLDRLGLHELSITGKL